MRKSQKKTGMLTKFWLKKLSVFCFRLDFVFKGGTALMLHLNSTERLSIDLDIIIPEKPEDLDEKLDKVATEQGFLRKEEQKRTVNSKIDKKHYKFFIHHFINQAGEKNLFCLISFLNQYNMKTGRD